MVDRSINDPTQFPCGVGPIAGSQGGGGSEPPVTGGVLVPKPSRIPIPPFQPSIPPDRPNIKCVLIFDLENAPPPKKGFKYKNNVYRECFPCDGGQNTRGYGPAANPSPGDAGCVYVDINTCEVQCDNPLQRLPGDIVPPPPGGGGGGGQQPQGQPAAAKPAQGIQPPPTGNIQYYKCVATQLGICPDPQQLDLSEATLLAVGTECVQCSPVFVSSNGVVVPDPECQFSSLALCQANCISPTFTNLTCPTPQDPPLTGVGGTTTTNEPTSQGGATLGQATGQGGSQLPVTPLGDPILFIPIGRNIIPSVGTTPQGVTTQSPSVNVNTFGQSVQITNAQQAINGNVINVNSLVAEESGSQRLPFGTSQPFLFDPNLNFFKTEPNTLLTKVYNRSYPKIFKENIAIEISEILVRTGSNSPWSEVTLQNLSDDKLIESIQPILLNSFQYLRYSGGEIIGLPTFLNIIRKHILRGTLDEFDPDFYIEAAKAQFEQKFDILEKPDQKERAERLAINYLKDNLNTYLSDKPSPRRNFYINRVRPLNEDVKIHLDVTLVDNSKKDLSIPNEGVEVEKLVALSQVTNPALGSPNKLNIGDGGGYYVSGEDIEGQGVAVYTENIIDRSYYAPPATRSKVLNMLGVDPSITITANSHTNKHEFAASDSGASSIAPLFFILDLNTVSGDYASNSLIEDYSGTYVRISSDSDIEKHVNNNALNTPMLTVDYRDPIYRYILDTSSFVASLKDFNLLGFKDKAFSSIGSRFVNNIPFGFVVTPVAGGKYNPFNGESTLLKYGDIHTRSLSVLPALDSSIESSPEAQFRVYNLNKKDGINSVGIGEGEDLQNIGFEYVESDYLNTFYSASAQEYGLSTTPPSAQGTAYMLREVLDYLSTTYDASTVTWYDVFSRMPMTQVAEMFYDSDDALINAIANGLRGNLKIENVEAGYETSTRIIPEDSKTIITEQDRKGVSTTVG